MDWWFAHLGPQLRLPRGTFTASGDIWIGLSNIFLSQKHISRTTTAHNTGFSMFTDFLKPDYLLTLILVRLSKIVNNRFYVG